MFEQQVLNTITKYNMINNNDIIIVAVSGGPDSMSLLNALIHLKSKLNINLVVAHVNHMIRSVADNETKYVEEFCKTNKIQCFVKKIDVLKKAESEKISTEEAGRNARYEFFEEVFQKVQATKIAIAHNKNDNAETVLMNIIRGTGISGLKGIKPIRENKFIRPLIEIDRKSIEEYCIKEKLNPKFDESNKENVYTRNKIRNKLIPYLQKEFNPNIIESINRLSDLATQENEYVERNVQKTFDDICVKDSKTEIILDLKGFNQIDYYIKSKIILLSVQKIFNTTKGIEMIHIQDIIKLCEKNIGNKFLMPNKNTKVMVNKGNIIISKEQIKTW